MKHKRVIGLTGGIATGKTTVLKAFARKGVPTISSDALAHACLRRGHPCYTRVVRHFGKAIIGAGGQVDRKKLGRFVFSQPHERKWLEKQIHPFVIAALKTFIQKHEGLILLDIPLLYEAKLQRLVDGVLVVWCSPDAQLTRMQSRDGLSPTEALQRLHAQMPLALKVKQADHVIDNNGSLSELRGAVSQLLIHLRRNA